MSNSANNQPPSSSSNHTKKNNIPNKQTALVNLNRPVRVGVGLIALISLAMMGVFLRVMQLQMRPSQPISEMLDSQHSQMPLLARRGNLVDRQGRIIATTRVAKRLFVDPLLIEDPMTFSEQVGYQLGYDPAEIERKISKHLDGRYVVLDPQLNSARLARLKGFKLAGLSTQPLLVRDYPLGHLAGQIIGFVGRDGKGLEGIEHLYEKSLAATHGKIRYWRDSKGQPLWVEEKGYHPPKNGHILELSLDMVIQTISETQLEKACKKFGAKSGQIVVIQPYSGEILAMANYPFFDPNQFGNVSENLRRNRCVTDAFEPGSTFKPFIWSAASEAGVVGEHEIIDCTTSGFYISPKGRRLHDAHGLGKLTWEQVLIKSSNIGMAIIGQRLGIKPMYQAVKAFGFGKVTGANLPGEAKGIVNPLKRWNHYSETSVPMGQEVAVTALQLARAFCVFANGGFMIQPTIFARNPIDPRNQVPIYERLLKPKTAWHVRQTLRRVVTQGTAKRANIPAYEIFGKTGTAQLPDHVRGGYMPNQYVSSFVSGAPFDDPQIVVVCVIHQPDKKKGHYGGTVAAPAAAEVIKQSLMYLGVPPKTMPENQNTLRNVGTLVLSHKH